MQLLCQITMSAYFLHNYLNYIQKKGLKLFKRLFGIGQRANLRKRETIFWLKKLRILEIEFIKERWPYYKALISFNNFTIRSFKKGKYSLKEVNTLRLN